MRRLLVGLAILLSAATLGAQTSSSAATRAFTGQLTNGDANGWNPAASTTYFWGTYQGADPNTTDGPLAYIAPRAGRLVSVVVQFKVAGTLGSAQNCTLTVRKNGSTDILTVSSTVQLTAASVGVTSTGNSVAVAQGDALYFKFATGAWTTAPTLVISSATLYFEAP